MCIISLSQPKCCAQRQVCGGPFHHSFIYSAKRKHYIRWVNNHFIDSSTPYTENTSLTYCSQCVKPNVKHWWLRRACATYHQPKCKEILLCEGGDWLSGSAVWLHSDGHCSPVPGTCIEKKSHKGHIENEVQKLLTWPPSAERWSIYDFILLPLSTAKHYIIKQTQEESKKWNRERKSVRDLRTQSGGFLGFIFASYPQASS